MTAQLVAFWIIAPISVVSAVLMVLQRHAVHSALFLIVNFFTIALFFLLLGSDFLFVVQIIVYAGAIMVLFLFVIMLLGVDREESLRERVAGQRGLAVILGLGLLAEIGTAVRLGVGLRGGALPDFSKVNAGGNVAALARVLFGGYFLPFEVTSILLIVAAIGVMLYGRRHPGDDDLIDVPRGGGAQAAPSPEPPSLDHDEAVPAGLGGGVDP